ncbi:coiled-coil domain-containing protein 40-like [Melanaphis sacchari]|uniref:coiled-coil domain-containing protein 40-like n=1 Tax=Melanaphis sacchari TaxID=742174 RepID=UPI000DC1342A|nr:coiled-coil domain-containing protein 40-like [Melanaphis sacchari]
MDNIETENHKLRDKQNTLEIDNDVENIHRDDLCIENPVGFISNLHESQDNNRSFDLKEEKLGNELDQQTNIMDPTSYTELLNFEDTSPESENLVDDHYSHNLDIETETSKKSSNSISSGFESINSDITYITPKSINKEIYNSQLIVLEPNNPVMVRFQKALKLHLLKQRENIRKELQTLDGFIRSKQKEKSSFINEISNVACRVDSQSKLLNEFHRMKQELKITKERVEECIEQRKQHYTEIHTTTTIESKKFSALKRQLDCSRGLLKELVKYEKEQEITFNVCNQKKSEAKQYKKKLLNDQQKQDLLLLSLTQEILRLEDRMKQLGELAETKYNEREVLRQKVMNNSTDLDAINEDNAKITLLWNDVLISIQQCDKCFLKTKNDLQEAKNKYHTLLMEDNSYKRSVKEEFHKNKDLFNYLNKLKLEQNNLQNNFKTCLNKFNCLKEEYSKLIQMTEFQHQNLDQITSVYSNLEQDIEKNTKYLNDQGFALSSLDSELKKLYIEIQNKTKQIDLENKQLEMIKKLHNDGHILTPQMQIDQVKNKIDEVVKGTNFIKQSWIQQQNKNVQLLAQLNNQFNELVKVRKYDLIMETKNKKLDEEIASLSKEVYQYKQTLTNMRNTILKLNEKFSQNKEKSNMLLSENEWIQCSYLAELKENEKLCLEYIDQLKLLKNELNELKNVYMEKQYESKSWDTKLQLLIEIKNEIKNKEGDLGDIDIMKNEIHRMQIRESQLKKILEKIMLDLEVCISRRETIYNKVAAKDIRLKGKNEAKQKFLKKLDYLRINIKKIKTVTILMNFFKT